MKEIGFNNTTFPQFNPLTRSLLGPTLFVTFFLPQQQAFCMFAGGESSWQ